VPFTAQTRMSGVDLHANGAEPKMRIRKGAADAVRGLSNWRVDFSAASDENSG